MSGVHEVEVDCSGCGRRQVTSTEQARKLRVMRCECGQFVRLDRALADRRSEPPPQSMPAQADDDDDDEHTHMLASLDAVANLRRERRRAPLPSMVDGERRSNPLRSLSPAPSRLGSVPPPSDKPLWFVNASGSEIVQMTIEQLIVARRSGKLDEEALVWREGMPNWRLVGTLIPAASTPRQTPVPPAPSRTPLPPARSQASPPPAPIRSALPSLPAVPTPQSLASYERPPAMLEFALEKPGISAANEARSALSSGAEQRPSRPPRALTPAPRPATWSASTVSKLPPGAVLAAAPSVAPAPASSPEAVAFPPPARLPTPLPVASDRPSINAPSAPVSFATDSPSQPVVDRLALAWLGDRPRWASACIALALCITASGTGAFLVRSLKLHRQPLVLSSGATSQPIVSLNALTPSKPTLLAPSAEASRPVVVDLQSLSVEHNAKHHAARPASVSALKVTAPAPAAPSDEASSDDAAPQVAPQKPRNSDLPSVAHANPYTTGSDDGAPKKPSATGSDEPGL